ncbi:plasmid mobilization relaxosome protein MobC [Phreatobacter sp.]|uniref:plasmid mobilization protein n=1 Tax=Phreatobacter sp. TaxID=1966341 RepID=UPI0025D0E1B2|nr:plasmid mobilization relaxosome protein MobC [Phreatobacter sp.]
MHRRTLTKQIMVRLSEADYAAVVRHAEEGGTQPAVLGRDLMIATVRGGERSVINQADLRDLLAELGRQGNNINQIARRVNSGEAVGLSAEKVEALVETHRELLTTALSLARKSR